MGILLKRQGIECKLKSVLHSACNKGGLKMNCSDCSIENIQQPCEACPNWKAQQSLRGTQRR